MSDQPSPFRIQPIIFTKAKTSIGGVRAEYLTEPSKVKFHFWPDPAFPQEFGQHIKAGLKSFDAKHITVEYVPEVDSWYLCIKDLPFQLNDFFVESILKKIALSVSDHA